MRKEIDEHERSEQGVRDTVHIAESGEKKRRQAERRRHRDVGIEARQFGTFVIGSILHIGTLSSLYDSFRVCAQAIQTRDKRVFVAGIAYAEAFRLAEAVPRSDENALSLVQFPRETV